MKSISWVCVLFLLTKSSLIAPAECDFEKIFRTPKDMSRQNFDHFEIVERTDFDRSELPTTTTDMPPVAPVAARNAPNIAHTHVSLRFGTDNIQGTNHIMKIPPQCRNYDFYYPHTYPAACHPHYYHPYPPPVPYVFPNYYFCNYGEQKGAIMPQQLIEYFRRHPEQQYSVEGEEVFIKGRPLKRGKLGDHVTAVNVVKPQLINIANAIQEHPKLAPLQPKIMKSLDLTNEDIEKAIVKIEVKHAKEKCGKDHDNSDSSEEKAKKHHKKARSKNKLSKKNYGEDVESLLNKALVAYKCQNCTGPPKMLVSYPITNRQENYIKPILIDRTETCPYCSHSKPGKFSSDIDGLSFLNTKNVKDDCKCINCQCIKNKERAAKKFLKDVDDLITIVYTEPVIATIPSTLQEDVSIVYPDFVPPIIPELSLDLANSNYKTIEEIPLKTSLNLDVSQLSSILKKPPVFHPAVPKVEIINLEDDFLLPPARSTKTAEKSSYYFIPEPNVSIKKPRYSQSEYCSSPLGSLFYQAPTEVEILNLKDDYSEPYTKGVMAAQQSDYYLFPNLDVSINKPQNEERLPKYLKVVPRDDLEIVSQQPENGNVCNKCGQVHKGGNFCCNCGSRIVVANDWSYCPTCPRESRQLNDW